MEENKIMPVIGETRENENVPENADFGSSFNHSCGYCFGGGMFCWNNRYGGLTFFYSPSEDDQNEEYKLFVTDNKGILFGSVTDSNDAYFEGDKEHSDDKYPRILIPTEMELTKLVLALARQLDFEGEAREKRFKEFCEDFLTPGADSGQGIQNISQIPAGVPEFIRKMDYNDFLETPYWKQVVREVKIKKGNRCELCGSSSNLEVHHPDYSFHGYEIENENRLTLLCHNCHSKFHNKKK